ncbi:MAG: DUF2807 domain-containing protein [Pseudomonadota bacterium]
MRWLRVTRTGFFGVLAIAACGFAAFGFVVSWAAAATTTGNTSDYQAETQRDTGGEAAALAVSSSRVQISNFQGRITLKVADVGTITMIDPRADHSGEKDYVTRLRETDDSVTFSVAGRKTLSDDDLQDFYRYQRRNQRQGGNEVLRAYLEDAPAVTLTVPTGTDIAIDRSIAIVTHEQPGTGTVDAQTLGHVKLGRGVIGATLGDLASGNIDVSGIADVTIGDVAGYLNGALSGSANFRAGALGAARLVLSGSGNIDTDDIGGHGDLILSGSGNLTVGSVANSVSGPSQNKSKEMTLLLTGSGNITANDVGRPVEARISGSGNIDVDNVDGDIRTQISGSGKVRAKTVKGGVSARISGSGDFDIDRVDGPVNISIGGNGRVRIDGGMAKDLSVSIAGNGHFTHRGTSTNLDASILGNGSIKVARNEGTLKTSNRDGVIEVNGVRIKPKRR